VDKKPIVFLQGVEEDGSVSLQGIEDSGLSLQEVEDRGKYSFGEAPSRRSRDAISMVGNDSTTLALYSRSRR
jgi:hypothetical protein